MLPNGLVQEQPKGKEGIIEELRRCARRIICVHLLQEGVQQVTEPPTIGCKEN